MTTRFTPVDPETPSAAPPRTGPLTALGRFVVRVLCDDTGAPSTARIVLPPWLVFTAFFLRRALGVTGPDDGVAVEAVFSVTAITLALILWAAALKLGPGVFVPLAEAVAGAFHRAVGAASSVWTGVRAYGGGPDRSVGVTDPGGELYRSRIPVGDPDIPPEPVIKSEEPQDP